MSLYASIKPKDKKDILVATGIPDGAQKEMNFYWRDTSEEIVKEKIRLFKGRDFKPVPIKMKNQIFSAYIVGQSGSGKTTFASQLIDDLMNKDKSIKNIFYITAQDAGILDDSMKALYRRINKVKKRDKKTGKIEEIEEPQLIRLDIYNPKLYEMEMSTFQNSVFLMDDIDHPDRKVEKSLDTFVKQILTMGRKLNISVCFLKHVALDRSKSKTQLMESQNICVFAHHNYRDSAQVMEKYLGYDKDKIQEITRLPSRFVYMRKTIPNMYITKTQMELM